MRMKAIKEFLKLRMLFLYKNGSQMINKKKEKFKYF